MIILGNSCRILTNSILNDTKILIFSVFIKDFRGVGKVRARTPRSVPAFLIDFRLSIDYFCVLFDEK